jgi:hypothetical protein
VADFVADFGCDRAAAGSASWRESSSSALMGSGHAQALSNSGWLVDDSLVAQRARDGLAVDLTRPERVGAIQVQGLPRETSALLPALVSRHLERPPERSVDLGKR